MHESAHLELLESNHRFPGVYQIKVIGSTDGDFGGRVTTAIREGLVVPSEINVKIRTTPDGRHVSLTLDVNVQTAGEVIALYAKIRGVQGVKFVL